MQDEHKSKQQLITELHELRLQLQELRASVNHVNFFNADVDEYIRATGY